MVRLNVLQSIRCCIKNKQSNWNFHLEQQIAGAIRATENRQTNFTPNMLFLGRETTQSKDLMLRTNKRNIPEKENSEYIQDLKQIWKNLIKWRVKILFSRAQHRQKWNYYTNFYQNTNLYNLGDVVLKID